MNDAVGLRKEGTDHLPHCWCGNKPLSKIRTSYA